MFGYLTYIKWSAIAAAIMFAAWFGRSFTALQYEAQIAEQNRQVAELQTENERKSVRVVTKYVDRVQEVEAQARTIVKEIPVYVTKDDDSRCVVPVGFVRIHDAAANGDAPSARDSNAAPSGVELSAVASTVADNYGICRQNSEQLKALQEWVQETHGQQKTP
jgi:hypothetical protein